MFAWIALGYAVFTAAGLAGGLYLAGRFEWPRKLYASLFGDAP
jgi:hypothetical protein